MLAAFVDGGEVTPAGLMAASSLLAWSPLGEPLRIATQSVRPAPDPLPMGGLEPLAPQLSLATDLAVVGGVALKRLADRLAQRGEAIASLLTARLRLLVRIGAYALVAVLSVNSLVGLISQGSPRDAHAAGGYYEPGAEAARRPPEAARAVIDSGPARLARLLEPSHVTAAERARSRDESRNDLNSSAGSGRAKR